MDAATCFAVADVANELDWIFWLVFWFGLMGVFKTTVDVVNK